MLAKVDSVSELCHIVQNSPQGDDAEAEVGEVIEYLARSKYLALPKEWQMCFQ